MDLQPFELSGPWWRRHRYWLTSPTPLVGTGAIVVNMRTGAAHGWTFRGNRRGRGWFGVRTRWVLLHPNWKRDPWVLFYVPVDGMAPDLTTEPSAPWWRSCGAGEETDRRRAARAPRPRRHGGRVGPRLDVAPRAPVSGDHS